MSPTAAREVPVRATREWRRKIFIWIAFVTDAVRAKLELLMFACAKRNLLA